jgi:hypothetical protein
MFGFEFGVFTVKLPDPEKTSGTDGLNGSGISPLGKVNLIIAESSASAVIIPPTNEDTIAHVAASAAIAVFDVMIDFAPVEARNPDEGLVTIH